MKWSLQELNKKYAVEFDVAFDLTQELTAREPEILDVSTVAVRGRVDADGGIYCLNFAADYTLTMPSCRSLIPVDVPMTFNVSEIFTTQEYFDAHKSDLDADMFFVLDKDVIDLGESVADNILLEIPMRVLTEEEKRSEDMPSGSSWQVLSEEDYLAMQAQENAEVEKKSPFSQLDGLFE